MSNIVLIRYQPYQMIFLILISIFVKLSMIFVTVLYLFTLVSYITKERNLQRYNKMKRFKLRIIYYANTSATFNFILLGNIEINPGPGFSAPKCTVCGKVVKINNKRLICSVCSILSMQNVINNPRIILSMQEYHAIIVVTVAYTRSGHFSLLQTSTQAMTSYQFKIRTRILVTA